MIILTRITRRVMERWIERGPGDTDEVDLERPKRNSIGEEGIYRMKVRRDSSYAIPEGMVKPCETISDDEPMDPAKQVLKKHAERREREERLCVLQGLLLFSIYALFSGEKEKHKKGRNLLARCVEVNQIVALLDTHNLSLASHDQYLRT